jgi:hypothetical protein
MRFMILSAFAGSWLLLTPAVWPQRPASAVISVVVGFVTMCLSPVATAWRPGRLVIAAGGMVLGLANFFAFDSVGIAANNAVVGLCLLCAGLGPSPRSTITRATQATDLPRPAAAAPTVEVPALTVDRPAA